MSEFLKDFFLFIGGFLNIGVILMFVVLVFVVRAVLKANAREETRQAVKIVLRPALGRMVMAAGTLDSHAQKQL